MLMQTDSHCTLLPRHACRSLRHRGPDWSGYDLIEVSEKRRHGIGHERLAIIDPESGAQPLQSPDGQASQFDDSEANGRVAVAS